MIEFTDITIREGHGHYNLVTDLMSKDIGDNEWMLNSLAYIKISNKIVFTYAIHFWRSGKVDIFETDRPMNIDFPEDDIRELHEWCKINNWKSLHVNSRLLVDPRGFDYWAHIYRCGLVENDQLKLFDESEMARLSQHGE